MNDKTLGEYKRTTPDPDETTGEALARLQAEMTRLLDEADADLRDVADGGVAAALIEKEVEQPDAEVRELRSALARELADWKVGMAAARKWLAAHDARVRQDAKREAYTTARSVLAGEDTVEWARGAHGSSMSYPHAIGIMDDLIEDLDEEVSP